MKNKHLGWKTIQMGSERELGKLNQCDTDAALRGEASPEAHGTLPRDKMVNPPETYSDPMFGFIHENVNRTESGGRETHSRSGDVNTPPSRHRERHWLLSSGNSSFSKGEAESESRYTEGVVLFGNLRFEPTADGPSRGPGSCLSGADRGVPSEGTQPLRGRLALSGHTSPCVCFQILCCFYSKVTSVLPQSYAFQDTNSSLSGRCGAEAGTSWRPREAWPPTPESFQTTSKTHAAGGEQSPHKFHTVSTAT